MAGKNPSQKRLLIDKANQRVIVFTSVATFITIFSLVAGQALFSQLLYQNRIVTAKKQALSQLKTDESALQNLDTAYQAFVSTSTNVIGGNPSGTGSNDGDNAKIVLDALPSKYDFPALATSLEKLLTAQNVQIQTIAGTDAEASQGVSKPTGTPQVTPIPFQVSASGNVQAVQNLVTTFENSIRPIQVQTMTLSGSNSNLSVTIAAQTYYQPEKAFTIGQKVIK